MDQDKHRQLEERLHRLEQTLRSTQAELQHVRQELTAATDIPAADQTSAPPPPPRPVATAPRSAPPAAGRPGPPPRQPSRPALPPNPRNGITLPEHMRSWEYWLNKLGIGLLLFGVVFLFKYSIDQGWITPPVRIAAGIGLGILLIVLGLFVYNKQRHFATVLLGGGIATYYITGWASIQVLDVWPYEVALTFMIATTLLSFALSLKQDEAILSLIAVAGGLATPFLLRGSGGSTIELMVYTSMLMLFSGGIYFYKGWRSLLWETIVGSWIVIMTGIAARSFSFYDRPFDEQLAVQGAIVVALLMFWAAPVAREILIRLKPSFLRPETIGFADTSVKPHAAKVLGGHVLVWTVSMPLISLMLSSWVWDLSDATWGWITLGYSAPYFLVWAGIRLKDELRLLGQMHLAIGLVLVTTALALLLDGNALYMTLAIEAVALFVAHDRTRSWLIGLEAHGLFFILAVWFLAIRLAESPATAFWNADTVADLWFVLALTAVAYFASDKTVRQLYATGAALALAAIFIRDLNRDLAFALIVGELLAMHLIAHRLKDNRLIEIVHLMGVPLLATLGVRLFDAPVTGMGLDNWGSAADLWFGAALIGIAYVITNPVFRRVYITAAALVIAAIFIRDLSTDMALLLTTTELLVFHIVARRMDDRNLGDVGHWLGAPLLLVLANRLFNGPQIGMAVFNQPALIDLYAIGAAIAIPYIATRRDVRHVYHIAVHAALLIWFWRELSTLPNGDGIVTVAWGLYGIAMLVFGLRKDIYRLRLVGLVTLLLVVGKLFLVDLARIETIWRILLFLSFGGVFLILSYYFKALWKPPAKAEAVESAEINQTDSDRPSLT